jgi:hypothetical protein
MRRFALKSEEKMLLRDRSVKEGEAQHAHFAGLDISVRQTGPAGMTKAIVVLSANRW